MNHSRGVMFLAEIQDHVLAGISAELANACAKIAGQSGEECLAVLLGEDISDSAWELVSMGVNKVYVVDNTAVSCYHPELYLEIMTQICQEVLPNVLLLGHTEVGRDLGPRLAFRLETGIVPNCVGLEVESGSGLLQMTRPVYGGKAYGIYTVDTGRPQIATVALKVFGPVPRETSRTGEIIPFPFDVETVSCKTHIVEWVEDSTEGVNLEEATVIVSGGRGVGSAENFRVLEELAGILGGCIGASRPAVDNGWAPSRVQIGLTGKVVSPEVYIAVGISGSLQHMAGCMPSKAIIAINRDPEAPIFSNVHFGVVWNWKEILPPLIEKCRALRQKVMTETEGSSGQAGCSTEKGSATGKIRQQSVENQ